MRLVRKKPGRGLIKPLSGLSVFLLPGRESALALTSTFLSLYVYLFVLNEETELAVEPLALTAVTFQ